MSLMRIKHSAVTSVRSGVRIQVERRPMSSTVPVHSESARITDQDRTIADHIYATEEVFSCLLGGQGTAKPPADSGERCGRCTPDC